VPPSGKLQPLSAALARAAIDSVGSAIVLVGDAGEVLYLNPAAEELFSRSLSVAGGEPVRDLPGGAPLAAIAARARQAQENQAAVFPSPSDRTVAMQVEASPLFDGSACLGTALELRTPRADERTLDFEALAAGLAHEIKNPLAGLQGSAELLAREAEGSAREYAQVIAREAKRVDGLVRELLDLARPAALQPAPVDIHNVLGDVRVLARGVPGADGVRFVERFDPSLPRVIGDEEKLMQVILNMVRNALDALAGRPDPQLTLETSVATQRVRLANGKTLPLARISVKDNGPGIPATMVPRLFTPFATSKPHGTGLGLAISRRIIDAHGGRIEVRNRSSGGVDASIYLPLEVG
jgi:two-component system, NtrC family, nitrogen regulation sensor histidine kinase GlnL